MTVWVIQEQKRITQKKSIKTSQLPNETESEVLVIIIKKIHYNLPKLKLSLCL